MFALSMGTGTDLAFPDVCLTPSPAGTVPIPYPDVSMSATSDPVCGNILYECTPTLNQASTGTVSVGDEPGIAGGVVSHDESGEALYTLGCLTIFVDGMPQQRLTSVTGQNAMGVLPNASGACIAPSQVTVLTLG